MLMGVKFLFSCTINDTNKDKVLYGIVAITGFEYIDKFAVYNSVTY